MADAPELVERVAQAIFDCTAPETAKPWKMQTTPTDTIIAEQYRIAARAAISAVDEMADQHTCGPQGCFKHVISAALAPEVLDG